MAIEYTSELRAKDADVARAMGWRQISPPDSTCAWRPPGSSERVLLPRFHESEDARRTLLEWLAKQTSPMIHGYRPWQWFIIQLQHQILQIDYEDSIPLDIVMNLLIATPAQVAEAAWQAIQEEKKNDR